MRNLYLLPYLFVVVLATSCATSAPQPTYLPQPLSTQNEEISDGYATTTVHKKVGASSSIEHSKTIMTLDNHLRGLAGVNVTGNGNTATVTVRGISSFMASTEPLFVVNGMQMSSYAVAYNTISPNDIKRVSVLSDAASTGIYGVRGSNGVIIVTLKNSSN